MGRYAEQILMGSKGAISAQETNKALLGAEPTRYFMGLAEAGKLHERFPEIDALRGVQQDSAYHPEGDAFIHTMIVLRHAAAVKSQAEDPLAFMYAALYHDAGKVKTTVYDKQKGRWTSIGHEDAGAQTARDAVIRLTWDGKLARYVENMVKMHMRPHNIPLTSKPKSTNRMFDESVSPEDLLLLFRCDTGREDADEKHMGRILWLESRMERYYAAIMKLEVTAEDLAALGYGTEPEFPAILAKCRHIYLAEVPKETILKMVPNIIKGMQMSIRRKIY